MKLLGAEIRQHRYFYLVVLGVVLLMMLTLPASMRGADGKEYLRWTHSLLFDQDLHLLNNVEAVGGGYRLTPTGYVFERVNIGAPFMWLPFYGAAFLFSPPSAEDPDSALGLTQLIWLNVSSWLYPVLGGILTFGALRRFFPARRVAGALLALLVGTPVLFYMMTFPMSSHPVLIFLASLLLFLWLPKNAGPDSSRQPTALYYGAVGVVLGWLMLIATYNVVLFLLPGFDLWRRLRSGSSWPRTFRNGLAVAAGGLLGFLPQMVVWWLLFGSPLYSPYSGQLFWSEPYLLETLFSTFHGLFFFAPVLLLVIPGLWWWRYQNGWSALGIGLAWILLAYVVSVNVAWWAGASFGNRYFLVLTPFFGLGLAAFLQKGGRWAAVLTGLAVLWTAGLYLQFLNGVWFTSDSIVYPARTLLQGQLSAWARSSALLYQLLAGRPWHLVPGAVLPVLIVGFVLIARIVYGWTVVSPQKAAGRAGQTVLVACGVGLLLFTALAGVRSEQARAALVARGFYDQPYQGVRREVREVAGKAGLVTRALFHRQTGQPQKAIADLQLASTLWRKEGVETSSRFYLGSTVELPQEVPLPVPLDYPGNVRLVGYRILERTPQAIRGELFWQKIGEQESRMAVTPVVRAFDRSGTLVGRTVVEFPFPAEYVPRHHFFKDSFHLQFDQPPADWIWLSLSLLERFALPVNGAGELDNGVFASVRVADSAAPALLPDESAPGVVVNPELLTPGPNQPGQTVPLQLIWRNAGQSSQTVALRLELQNAAGQKVAQEQIPLSQTGPPAHQTYCFTLPTSLSAGEYRLLFSLDPAEAGALLNPAGHLEASFEERIDISSETQKKQATICNLIQADFSRRYEPTTPQHRLETILTPEIMLAGYNLSIVPQAESALARVLLHWHVRENVIHDYLAAVRLLDQAGQPVINHTAIPVHQTRPTSTWLAGEWILDERLLEVPPLPPGTYQLTVSLLDEQTGLPPEQVEHPDLVLEEISLP